ncbi:MAG TPA: FKBP-type peptidyl-prolyl cis-trans isomerase [Ignavibacteriales bacterium]|nr:FKBP-type peptidyl-prolyl cis-trans isomerase [Ignavibacteriales bacterium]
MKIRLVAILAVLSVGIAACRQEVKKEDLKTSKDKASYAIGLDIGKTFKRQAVEINEDALLQGIKDAIKKDSLYLLTEAEIKETMINFSKEMQEKQTAKLKELGDKNKKEGEAFLAENKTKDGVKTTASGLQYKVISSGNGATPKATDKVKVNYRGTLINGTEFDNSYKRGEPIVFNVGSVIKGWTEALQLMKVGDKWQLFIPSDLAYGPQGAGQAIPPNSTLIFDVELLGIEK